jgi:hypothetical protein
MPPVPRPRSKGTKAESETPKTDTTRTTESSGSPTPPRMSREDVKLRESIKGMYEGVAMLAMGIGFNRQHAGLLQFAGTLMEPQQVVMADGSVVTPDPRTGADKIADAWMTAADRNARVKIALRRVTEGGALAEVAALHVTLILPFLPGIPGLSFMNPAPASENGSAPS